MERFAHRFRHKGIRFYDPILIIIDQLTKMVYYELVKITIRSLALAKVIIETVVQYYNHPDLIFRD